MPAVTPSGIVPAAYKAVCKFVHAEPNAMKEQLAPVIGEANRVCTATLQTMIAFLAQDRFSNARR
jgi:hypothetical protein